jgi:hypothetical protein
MGYNDHMRSSDAQSTATFSQDQIEGDEYTREENPDPRSQDGKGSYWNHVDED